MAVGASRAKYRDVRIAGVVVDIRAAGAGSGSGSSGKLAAYHSTYPYRPSTAGAE